jgi:hypothetical protein
LQELLDDAGTAVDKGALTGLIGRAVPTMRHVETGRNLDQRM